jgi:hypothetical protein
MAAPSGTRTAGRGMGLLRRESAGGRKPLRLRDSGPPPPAARGGHLGSSGWERARGGGGRGQVSRIGRTWVAWKPEEPAVRGPRCGGGGHRLGDSGIGWEAQGGSNEMKRRAIGDTELREAESGTEQVRVQERHARQS